MERAHRRRSPGWCSSRRSCPSLRSASASIVWRATSISRLLRWASGSSSGSAGCLLSPARHRSRRVRDGGAGDEEQAGPPRTVLAGVILAALAGGVVGTVAGRLRPALVAVFTWLLAWLVAIGLTAYPSISGGAQGIAVEQGSIAGIELGDNPLRRRTDGARRSVLLRVTPAKPRGRCALGRPPAPSGRGSSRGPGGSTACHDLRARCRACGGGWRPRCPSRPGGRCRSVRAVALGEALHRHRSRRSRRSGGRARRRSGAAPCSSHLAWEAEGWKASRRPDSRRCSSR